jgi:hypothetical protein
MIKQAVFFLLVLVFSALNLSAHALVPVSENLDRWLWDSKIPSTTEARFSAYFKEPPDEIDRLNMISNLIQNLRIESKEWVGVTRAQLLGEISVHIVAQKSQIVLLRKLGEGILTGISEIGDLGSWDVTRQKIFQLQEETFKDQRTLPELARKEMASKVSELIESEFALRHSVIGETRTALIAVLTDPAAKEILDSEEWMTLARDGALGSYQRRNPLDFRVRQSDPVPRKEGFFMALMWGRGFNGDNNYGWSYRQLPRVADARHYLLTLIRRKSDIKHFTTYSYARVQGSPDLDPRYQLVLPEGAKEDEVAPNP